MTTALKQITVHEASIKTAAIAIKTLSIGTKQVTLAVFRQLDERDLIDPNTGELCGLPWGRINYHPDKCAEGREHLHVVWQQGESIFRANVKLKPEHGDGIRGKYSQLDGYLQQHVTSSVLKGVGSFAAVYDVKKDIYRSDFERWINLKGYRFCWYAPNNLRQMIEAQEQREKFEAKRNGKRPEYYSPEQWDNYVNGEDARIKADEDDRDRLLNLTVVDEINRLLDEVQTYESKWKLNYETLQALDLLFIAV